MKPAYYDEYLNAVCTADQTARTATLALEASHAAYDAYIAAKQAADDLAALRDALLPTISKSNHETLRHQTYEARDLAYAAHIAYRERLDHFVTADEEARDAREAMHLAWSRYMANRNVSNQWTFEGWHFLPPDKKLYDCGIHPEEDRRLVRVGDTFRMDRPLEMYTRGFHASRRALDALTSITFAYCGFDMVVCWVVLSGDIIKEGETAVATERTTIWMASAQEALAKVSALWTERNQGTQDSTASFYQIASSLSEKAAHAAYDHREDNNAWNDVYMATWDALNDELEHELFKLAPR